MSNSFDYGLQYGEFHQDSDEYFAGRVAIEEDRLNRFIESSTNRDAALDIGCGMGFTMGALLKHGFRSVRGIDLDRSQVIAARGRGFEVEQTASIVDFLRDYKDAFSFITMIDVLEHVPTDSQVETLKSIHAALRPGGRLIVQVPNANSIVAARWRYNDFTHICSYTEQSLRPLLRNSGFESIEVPPDGNVLHRPSLRPNRILSKATRDQFRRWLVRHVWRQVMYAEIGDTALRIPLGLNLTAIADKQS